MGEADYKLINAEEFQIVPGTLAKIEQSNMRKRLCGGRIFSYEDLRTLSWEDGFRAEA